MLTIGIKKIFDVSILLVEEKRWVLWRSWRSLSVIDLSGGWGDGEELATERFMEGGRI